MHKNGQKYVNSVKTTFYYGPKKLIGFPNQMIPNFGGWRLEFTESREQGFQRGDRDYEKNVRKPKVAKFVP